MKLSTFVTIAAVIGGTFLIPTSAEDLSKVQQSSTKENDFYRRFKLDFDENTVDSRAEIPFAKRATAKILGNNDWSDFRPDNLRQVSGSCPAGTRYHTIKVGGLIKRTAAQGYFIDFQASQLRMQANAKQQQQSSRKHNHCREGANLHSQRR